MFFKSCYVDAFTVIIFYFIIRIKNLITHLFQKLIYEIQSNLHQLTPHMSTLIIWHNRFSENENETKKPWHRVPVEFWPLCPLIVKRSVKRRSIKTTILQTVRIVGIHNDKDNWKVRHGSSWWSYVMAIEILKPNLLCIHQIKNGNVATSFASER